MKEGLQSFLKAAGDWSCLCLCIIKIAEEINKEAYEWGSALSMLLAGVQAGYVYCNFKDLSDPKNFDVLDNAGFLKFLIKKPVTVRFISDFGQIRTWQAKENEYTVQRYVRKGDNGELIYHFRRPSWDPLVWSRTVAEGAVDRLTVFTVG
jgi:hypothetical protein